MADTVAVMNKGAIEQMGSPEELYELPRTAFVANFLGQSNLFTGEVVASTGDGDHRRHRRRKRRGAPDRARAPPGEGHNRRAAREAALLTRGAQRGRAGAQRARAGPCRRRLVRGVSTQYLVEVPGARHADRVRAEHGFGPVVDCGAEVWVTLGRRRTGSASTTMPARRRASLPTRTPRRSPPSVASARSGARGSLRWRSPPSRPRRGAAQAPTRASRIALFLLLPGSRTSACSSSSRSSR